MDYELLWDKIIKELLDREIELKTGSGLWIRAYVESDNLFVDKSINNNPSSKMSERRRINKKDFLKVCDYYDRWRQGEVGIRHEVSRLSRNTAYIFGLINYFK